MIRNKHLTNSASTFFFHQVPGKLELFKVSVTNSQDIVVFSAMKFLTLEKSGGGGAFCYLDLLKYGGFNQWKNKEKYKSYEFGEADKVIIIHL